MVLFTRFNIEKGGGGWVRGNSGGSVRIGGDGADKIDGQWIF